MVSSSGSSIDYLITTPAAGAVQVQDSVPGAGWDGYLGRCGAYAVSGYVSGFRSRSVPGCRETAELLGASFGKSALSNASCVGIGIALFDAGYNMDQVAGMVVNTGRVSAPDNSSFVKAVWFNVFGTAIDSNDLATFTQLLNSSQYSQASLLALADSASANQTHIGLVGLAAHGIDYLPA